MVYQNIVYIAIISISVYIFNVYFICNYDWDGFWHMFVGIDMFWIRKWMGILAVYK